MGGLDLVLTQLAGLLGSPEGSLTISSGELGGNLSVSQQTASRYLKQLDEAGLIERKVTGSGQEIKLTSRGLERIKKIHSSLSLFLSAKPKSLSGVVVSGLGEGAYYVREYAGKIREKLGYAPHPGTLNLRLGVKIVLPDECEIIPAFKKGERSFGQVRLYPVELSTRKAAVSAHLIVPDRTHHKEDLEFIAKLNLRKKLSIKDAGRVSVKLLN